MPGAAVRSWLGVFRSSFNTSAAAWESGTANFETWLTNGSTPAILATQTLGYADTGSNTTWNGQAQLLVSRWITVANGSHPGLVFRLGIPMVASDADWDNLLAGTWDAQFAGFNQYIVNHDGDVAGGMARLLRLRIGWEGNGSDYAWSHRPPSTFPGSTYTIAKYRAGWRRIAVLFAGARALGTKLVYNPNLPLKSVGWGTTAITVSGFPGQWPGLDDAGVPIPGFSLVDVLAGDAYDQWIGGPTITQQQRWSNMYNGTNGIAQLIAFAASHGNLPVSFDEWGIDLNTTVLAPPNQAKHSGDDSYYVQQMSQVMQGLITAGTFDGHCYWDNNNNITSQLSPTTIGPLAAAQFLAIWGNQRVWAIYQKAKKKIFNGSIRLGVDTFKLLLVQTTSNFATLTLSAVGSLTNQVASAGGYVQAGLPMVVTWTAGSSAGSYTFSMLPLLQTATGAPIVNIRAAVVKNSAGQLLCFAAITTSQFAVPQGSTITFAPTAGGIFTLSSPVPPVSITPAVAALAITLSAPIVTNSSSVNALRSVRPMRNFNTVGTPASFFKEFGAHFKQGDIPVGSKLAWRLADGTTGFSSQADNRVTWPDGSLRSCSATIRYPLVVQAAGTAGDTTTIRGYAVPGTWDNTSWTTNAAITGRDIRLEFTKATPQSQVIGTGDGTTVTFSGTLAGAPLKPGSVTVSWTKSGTKQVNDNGAGGFAAIAWLSSGSINYTTGLVSLTVPTVYAPTAATPVTAVFATTTNTGTVYTLSANNEVTRGTNVTQVRSGPLSACWKIFGELRDGTAINSTPEGTMWAVLYLTFFNDNTYSAWGTIYNGRSTATTVSAQLGIGYKIRDYAAGPTDLFNFTSAFKIYAGCAVYCVNTDGLHPYTGTSVDKCVVGFPPLTFGDSTTTGLYDSYQTWWQVWSPAMISALTINSAFSYVPCGSADYKNINGTGSHSWVGLYTSFAAAAWLSGTWLALRADRINAFDWASNMIAFPNAATGYPANLTNTTYSGLGTATQSLQWNSNSSGIVLNGGFPPGADSGTAPGDGSHAPFYPWYQLLATGQEPWLDMGHDQCIGQLGWYSGPVPGSATGSSNSSGTRNALINGIQFVGNYNLISQQRSLAWNSRNIGYAYWLCPDNHPMKPYLSRVELTTYDAVAEYVRPPNSPASMATLGIYHGTGNTIGNDAPWMHDFHLSSICSAIRRGRITTAQNFVTFHVIPWTLGRYYGGCPWAAVSTRMSIQPGPDYNVPAMGTSPGFAGSSFCQSWSEVWWDDGNSLGIQPVTQGPSGGVCPTSGLNPFSSSWDFRSLAQNTAAIGLATCATSMQLGLTNAAAAWAYMEQQLINAAKTEAQWAAPACVQWRIDTPRVQNTFPTLP